MVRYLKHIYILSFILLGCSSELTDSVPVQVEDSDENVIHVGGVETSGLTVASVTTRAVTSKPAEDLPWLRGPLFAGLDITYKKGNNSKIAVLKLKADGKGGYSKSEEGLAEYTFYNRADDTGEDTTIPAKWFDNGEHIFEGLYVPENIQYHLNQAGDKQDENLDDVYKEGRAPKLTTDQHDINYAYLEQYLGMPANYKINATVGRIVLPFRHRLSRVIAFILIDPALAGATIKGYELVNGKDDPTTSSITFGNVRVLAGVKDSFDSGKQHHTFTPQWGRSRKVVPHFVGEKGSYKSLSDSSPAAENFIMYYTDIEDSKTYVYPSNYKWASIRANKGSYNGIKYDSINYGPVPCYDLIVRPTYTNENNVMYDEEDVNRTHTNTNNITFDITLSNGLVYQKDFEFDLNANQQTMVYLRITPEQVDYNSSGSEVWEANFGDDGYFGVNNENGNTLSLAGSGWQRAYSNVKDGKDYQITDGSKYPEDEEADHIEGEDGQYLTPGSWIKKFFEANKKGNHHGDYFILENDITIPASMIPDNFVFTGHLDGRGHKINVTGAGEKAVTTNYESELPFYYKKKGSDDYTLFEIGIGDGKTTLYVSKEEAHVRPAVTGDDSPNIPGGEGKMEVANPQPSSLSAAMADGANYFVKNPDGTYTALKDITFYRVAPACLFWGLDGEYTTAQETDATQPWEANVHKEKRKDKQVWVPTMGYRAEVLNTEVLCCRLFKDGATFKGTETSGTFDVTGFVYQSSGSEGKVTNDPGIPKYN